MKQFFLSLIAGFLGAFLYHHLSLTSAAAGGERVMSATAFNLVDSAGKLRGQFAMGSEGPGFWLMDKNGVARVSLGVYADNTGYMGLQDKNREMIELLRSWGAQEAPLLIFKNNARNMMITGLNPQGEPEPFLMTFDKARKTKMHFGNYDGPK